jgi:hypothetical protein
VTDKGGDEAHDEVPIILLSVMPTA